ncbi:MAG: benzene 1,2-dioxygenase [Rugosibacter sp.]|nr:MAG: benzene 1,2-dioxygenase [Rugosibacter sp.]
MNAINEPTHVATTHAAWHSVVRFLGQEAKHLDDKNWDAWLELYAPDVDYWIPAWDSDGTLVTDPTKHVSLIYYKNRGGLEDRIFRIRTGRSASSTPLARTCHQFQLIELTESEGLLKARVNWRVDSVMDHEVRSYFGTAYYTLAAEGSGFLIKAKKTVVLNDRIDQVLDVYLV